jgi:hypothetical protein
MVQVAVDEIVHMIAVRDRFVTAARAVLVGGLVPVAVMIGGASRRVGIADLDRVLVDVIAMGVMEVAVVQVVGVARMYHADVTAVGPVSVSVSLVHIVGFHRSLLRFAYRLTLGGRAAVRKAAPGGSVNRSGPRYGGSPAYAYSSNAVASCRTNTGARCMGYNGEVAPPSDDESAGEGGKRRGAGGTR